MKHPLIIDSNGKPVDKQGVIARHISSPAGRAALAAAMAMPLRRSLNYQGLARKALQIEQLPTGALPYYDKDILGTVVGEKKEFQHNRLIIRSNGKPFRGRHGQVVIPDFEVYSSPTIKIGEVKRRRFNVIDRAVQKARRQLMSREDERIFKALDSLGNSGNKR